MAAGTGKFSLIRPGNTCPFLLITSLFFHWALANNMTDKLLSAFKRITSMSDFQTTWIQMAFYGAYFCLALPAAVLIKRYTYKTAVLAGLRLFILGSVLFYPASLTMAYGHFLIALYVLAGGLSILETAANPYIVAIEPEEAGTKCRELEDWASTIKTLAAYRVNAIIVAESWTSAYEKWIKTLPNPEEMQTETNSRMPLENRMTTPEEIANTTAFLLSERSSHTTGQLIHVVGGYVHLDREMINA